MIRIVRNFVIILITFLLMILIVYKPHKPEVVDVAKFIEYYSTDSDEGLELVKDNFYVIEMEYSLTTPIPEYIPKDQEIGLALNEKYEIPKMETYKIVSGDTLSEIAEKNNMTLSVLKANNPGISTNLKVGQEVNVVKGNGVFYKVKRGDVLSKIAQNFQVDIEELRNYNKIQNDVINIGQELFIYNPSNESLKRLIISGEMKTTTKRFAMPVKWAGVTSGFGSRLHPVLKRYIYHAGIDMKARYVPLMASRSGKVTYAGYMNGYGNIIKIDHGGGYETRSAHLDKMYVKKGDVVTEGQVIGKTGMTGRVTGPHLHFEIRKNGKAYNPMNYLKR